MELTFEAQNFSKQVQTIQKEINNTEKRFKNASKSIDDFEQSFQGLDAKIKKNEKQLSLYNTKLEKQREEYDKLKSTVSSQIEKLNELEKTQGKGSEEWKKQAELVAKNSQKLSKLKTDMNGTETSISKLSKELTKSKNEFDNVDKMVKSLDVSLEDISRQTKLSESEFNKLASELDDTASIFGSLQLELNRVTSKFDGTQKKAQAYKNEIKNLNTTLASSKKDHSELEKKISTYQVQLDRCIAVYGENSKQAESYRTKLYKLKDEHFQLGKEIEKNNNTLDEYQTELNNTEVELNQLAKEMKSMPFDKLSADLKTAGEKLKSIGSSLTRNVTLPITAMATAASKFAMDFESGMAKVETIADTSKTSIGELKKGVIDLSNKTGKGTDELTESLYGAISASVDTAKAVEFLDTAVKAAVGGFTDTETAVDGLSSVLNSYGLSADEANKIANEMLITQNKGKTTFGELAKDIGKVTPIFSALNVETKELFSSLAVTTAQGLGTSEAITGLKASMTNIIKPSKEAKDAAEALGIEFSISALQSKGWIGFLSDVKEGLKGASPELDILIAAMEKASGKMLALSKSGQEGSKEYKIAQKEFKGFQKELEMMSAMADSPVSAMSTLFGSVEGLNSILMLTSENGMAVYNDTLKEMETNTGLLDDAYAKMTNTTEFKLKKALNDSKNALMELGVKLLPTINKLIEAFSSLVDKFSSLNPETQESIIKFGALAAILGPVISGIGGLTSGLGSLVKFGGKSIDFLGKFDKSAKVAGKAAEAVGLSARVASGAKGLGALVSGLGSAVVSAAPWILAAGAVVGAGYGIYKGLTQEVIPSVDLFADKITYTSGQMNQYGATVQAETVKISEATQQAVGSYLEMSEGVTQTLNGLYFSTAAITEETCNDLTTKYADMGNMITTKLIEDKTADLETLTTFFGNSTTLTAEQEAEMLRLTGEAYDGKKTKVETTQAEITAILQLAKEQQRELTEDEVKTIGELQDQMRTQAIKALSDQELEANIILERMSSYDKRITAEQAGEHIRAFNQQRDSVVDSANTEYLKNVETFKKMRDELGVISDEQCQALIQDAEEQRDKTVSAADETKEKAIDKIFTMNSDLVKNVDSSTGDIVSFWDKLFGKWDKWQPKAKTVRVNSSVDAVAGAVINGNTRNYEPVSFRSAVPQMSMLMSRGISDLKADFNTEAPRSMLQSSPVATRGISIPTNDFALNSSFFSPSIANQEPGKSVERKQENKIKKSEKKEEVFIIQNHMDSRVIGETVYKKVDGKLALANKRGR